MFILQRYIGFNVVRGFFLLALIVVSLFSIILLIDELDYVGDGNYTWWLALKYVVLHAPKFLLDFAAFISLIGSIIALGSMAAHHELVAIESVGVAPISVIKSVIIAALILMTIVMINAQYVIPATLQAAHINKTLAIEGRGEFISEAGYWAQKNHSFIHIKQVENGRIPSDVEIFEFNSAYELQNYYFAEKVLIEDGQDWQLLDVTLKRVINEELYVQKLASVSWKSFLTASQLGVIVVKPEALSMTNLYYFIQGLKQRGEQSYRYELLFWQKLITPVSAAIMILLGMPFVFGSQRHVSTGKRITMGVLAGIAFYVMTQIISYSGTTLLWPPVITAVIPIGIASILLITIQISTRRSI